MAGRVVKIVVGVIAVVIVVSVIYANSHSTNKTPSSSSSPTPLDMVASATINNEVEGAYTNESYAEKVQRGQAMLGYIADSKDATLMREANQLQADANAGSQSAVNNDLANLAQRCETLGIGPTSSGGG